MHIATGKCKSILYETCFCLLTCIVHVKCFSRQCVKTSENNVIANYEEEFVSLELYRYLSVQINLKCNVQVEKSLLF